MANQKGVQLIKQLQLLRRGLVGEGFLDMVWRHPANVLYWLVKFAYRPFPRTIFLSKYITFAYCMSDTLSHTNYHDNSFNLDQAGDYILLIQVKGPCFDFAVVHDNRLLVYVQNTPLDELSSPKPLRGLLSASYKKVITGLFATALTLVPNSLYSDEQAAAFARFLDVQDDEKALAERFDDQNHLVYKNGMDIIAAVEKIGFQNVVYTAQGWVKAIANSSPPNSNLYLNIAGDTVHFLYFSFGSLRFYNRFEFKNPDELVYFTARVTEELTLSAEEITLCISGDAYEWDTNLTRLKEFYTKVELNNLQIFDLPSQVAAHKILPLAALSLCGSLEVR